MQTAAAAKQNEHELAEKRPIVAQHTLAFSASWTFAAVFWLDR